MLNLIFFLLSVFMLVSIFLYLMQDRMIFLPPGIDKPAYAKFNNQELRLKTSVSDIHGWQVVTGKDSQKSILYFGGNAEDAVYMNYEAVRFNARQILSLNYPGYGESSSVPSQENLYQSALEIYDSLLDKKIIEADKLIIMGRSLGSSVAAYVAAHRPVAGLILITPFDSMENVAVHHYKIFPVRLLLKHQFPTVEYLPGHNGPLLVVAAANDEIISQENFKNLESVLHSNAKVIRYEGVGHNTIQSHMNYYNDINSFIDSVRK